MKKLTHILFCFVLLLTLSLAAVSAASAEEYGIWVNGEQFTSDQMEIVCGDGTATLTLPIQGNDPYTVTLTDAVISKAYSPIRADSGIYSTKKLDVVMKGANRIAIKPERRVGIFAEKILTLKGEGSLTIENSRDSCGINAKESVYHQMDGALTIQNGYYGILAKQFLNFAGKGDVEITGCETAVCFEESDIIFSKSGSGNMTLNGTKYGISFGPKGDLTLNGSGKVDISGGSCGMYSASRDDFDCFTVRLNGDENPVTISTTDGARAIEGGEVFIKSAKYRFIGAPDQKKVVYFWEDPIISVPYDVWVNGEQFVSDKPIIDCGSGTAVLEPPAESGKPFTLTLTDATISKGYQHGTRCGVYSMYDLVVVLKGRNTIALDAQTGVGFYPDRSLTLKGDGSLTIINQKNSAGFYLMHGGLTIAMDGDLTIQGGAYGVKTDQSVKVTGKGNLSITDCDTCVSIEYANRSLTLTGSGNVNLVGTNRGISMHRDNRLELEGSGEVNISGGNCGASFIPGSYGETGWILLNGQQNPITISTTNGVRAIENASVSGRNQKNYHVHGSPREKKVVYFWEDPIISIPYDVWVNGEQFLSNKLFIECGSGTAVLEPPAESGKPYTVTLTDATITKYGPSGPGRAVYSMYDLEVVLKGRNTIALDAQTVVDFFSDGNLTLKGDGSLTIVNQKNSAGFYLMNGKLTIAMDGDLTVQGGAYGIRTNGSVNVTGNGNLAITGCDTVVSIEEANRSFTLSGSGNVNLVGTNQCISMGRNSRLILNGSGEVNLSGGNCGAAFKTGVYDEPGSIVLDGRQTPITISTTHGARAVENGEVFGQNYRDYRVIGSPNEKLVVYTYNQDVPKTGDDATPLLWTLLAAASCTALLLLRKRMSRS